MSTPGQQDQRQLFARAQRLLQAGEAEAAQTICADVLARYPEDANFLCLSAQALTRLGHFDEAQVRIEAALGIFPEFERAHEAKGDLLLARGELSEAVEALQEALRLNPNRQQTRLKLGRLFLRMGYVDKARRLRGEFLKRGTDNPDIVRATNLEKEEKFADAEQVYRQTLTRHPDNVTAMRLWARLGIRQKRYEDAEILLARAVEVAPDFNQAWADLVAVLYEQQKLDEAAESARRLIKLDPRIPNGYLLLASAYASAGHHDEALSAFDDALAIAPKHVGALCGKGNVCRTVGDQVGAIAAFRSSIEANPLHAEAYWNLANLKTFLFADDELDQMLGLIGDGRIPSEGQVQLNNALGLGFEARGDYNRAFEYIDRGNALRREQEFYDRVENEEMVDMTIDVLGKAFLDANAERGDPDPAPIFIVGLPRSGSTLIEQILASHSLVDGTHELRDLGMVIKADPRLGRFNPRYPKSLVDFDPGGLRQLGAEYIRRTRRYRGDRPFFTDKNPNNFVHVGLLHLILPNAKIIDARRHPLDSCLGSYKQLFAQGQPFSYDLVELGEYYLEYDRLMNHWNQVLPGNVLDVHYEQVVADLEGQVRRILDHCGLPWEDACLRFHETDRAVKSASSEQVRQPIYSTSVNTWRNYERHLGPLIEVLKPILAELPDCERPGSLSGSG
ncbi:MAG: sulfotransferase [Gammaproteobacteria bacterium]|nr:sulfotransferase [Gammaproteobacteria bacterium]